MKTSAALLAAAATLAMARPEFLNTNFDVTPGEPFTLRFRGCDDGCDIILLNGDPDDLKEVQTLVRDVTGGSETITLSERFNKDTYAFRIVDQDGEENYSEQFEFDGQDAPETTEAETSTVAETTTSAESTSTEETTTAEETTTTEAETTTSAEETTTVTTPASSTTESESPSSTTSDDAEETGDSDDSAPDEDDAAVRLGSSHVALAAAVVALAGFVL